MDQDKAHSTMVLPSIHCEVRLGWSDAERAIPQPVSIAVAIRFARPPLAIATDELADTMDYGQLVGAAERLCDTRAYRLIEHLANEVYDAFKTRAPKGASVWVEITKPRTPLPALRQGARFALGDWEPGALALAAPAGSPDEHHVDSQSGGSTWRASARAATRSHRGQIVRRQ
jgi:dihydroneopterin aldolase